jgi:hypothetical protein
MTEFGLGNRSRNLAGSFSFFAQVTGLFTSPARTFADAARRPRFLAPFLATLIVVAGFWGVVYLKLGLPGMAVALVQDLRRGTLVTQDEIDLTLLFSIAVAPAILIGSASAILFHLLLVAWAGARLAHVFFGVGLRLRGALSLVCYAYLAKAIAQAVRGVPMVLFGDVQGLNFGNLLPTNIAFFLDPKDVSRTVYALLQALDLVPLWYFALLGIGLSVDSDDPASPPVIAVSLAALWTGWNVFFAASADILIHR